MDSKVQLEEKLNTYSHGLGVLLALLGSYFLLTNTSGNLLPVIIYILSLVLLFSASTGYHASRKPVIKKKLRILDHISIYYLIAGTYTPVCLGVLQDSKGILLLCSVWGIAVLGTILKLFFTGKFELLSLLLYAVMGWLVVLDYTFLKENISSSALFYLGLGGILYTIGILFYAVKKIPYNHFIWHLFVLGGAISHWFFIFNILS